MCLGGRGDISDSKSLPKQTSVISWLAYLKKRNTKTPDLRVDTVLSPKDPLRLD